MQDSAIFSSKFFRKAVPRLFPSLTSAENNQRTDSSLTFSGIPPTLPAMAFKLRSLTAGLAYRGLQRRLDRLIEAQQEQNQLLLRLVDRFAPPMDLPGAAPPVARDQARLTPSDRGDISHLDPDEMQAAQAFIDKWGRANGYAPSDEEVFAYLAEHHTQELAKSLNDSREAPWPH